MRADCFQESLSKLSWVSSTHIYCPLAVIFWTYNSTTFNPASLLFFSLCCFGHYNCFLKAQKKNGFQSQRSRFLYRIWLSLINIFRLLFRLGKVVNRKKVQAEGFEKYFNKGSGKLESNDIDLSEVVNEDENKVKDGVSFCLISCNFCARFHGS